MIESKKYRKEANKNPRGDEKNFEVNREFKRKLMEIIKSYEKIYCNNTAKKDR